MAARSHAPSEALRPELVLKVAICVGVIATVSLGYVAKKNHLIQLGRQITEREAQLDQLIRQNRWRTIQLEDLVLPQKLVQRVQQLQLGLISVSQTQWVKMPEPDGHVPVPPPGPPLLVNK